jgi:hypothetical protein
MSLQEGEARLDRAVRELAMAWQRTAESWRDERARAVAAELLDPLAAASHRAGESISHLRHAVAAAKRDCAER